MSLGKWIGGIVGWMTGGAFGALAGIALAICSIKDWIV